MRYTYVKQHDATDCAAACLAMVCLYYKKETTIIKLRDMMGTDLKGTNLLGLSNCAGQLGFTAQAVRVDRESLKSKFTLPAIANVITKEGLAHFVVIFKITERYVVYRDSHHYRKHYCLFGRETFECRDSKKYLICWDWDTDGRSHLKKAKL